MNQKNQETPGAAEAKIFSGDPGDMPGTGALIQSGKSLVKSEAGYHTAIAVQRPRDLNKVVAAVEREAELAGTNFYYSWRQRATDPDTGEKKKVTIEGGTIGLALCMAREWTNCAILTDVQEVKGSWLFNNSFVDLERGFTIERAYRKTIPRGSVGKYSNERWSDMQFQKAQSQGIRNIVFNGTPRWLQKRAIKVAKAAAIKGITAEGLEKSKAAALAEFSKLGVTKAQLESYLDVPLLTWTIEDLHDLKSVLTQIENGDVSVDEAFEKGPEAAGEPGGETEKEKAGNGGAGQEEAGAGAAQTGEAGKALCPNTGEPLTAEACALCKELATCNAMGPEESQPKEVEKPKPSVVETAKVPISLECKTKGAHPGRKVHIDYCRVTCQKRKDCAELRAAGVQPVFNK